MGKGKKVKVSEENKFKGDTRCSSTDFDLV